MDKQIFDYPYHEFGVPDPELIFGILQVVPKSLTGLDRLLAGQLLAGQDAVYVLHHLVIMFRLRHLDPNSISTRSSGDCLSGWAPSLLIRFRPAGVSPNSREYVMMSSRNFSIT